MEGRERASETMKRERSWWWKSTMMMRRSLGLRVSVSVNENESEGAGEAAFENGYETKIGS